MYCPTFRKALQDTKVLIIVWAFLFKIMSSFQGSEQPIFACTDAGQEVPLDENAFPQVKGTKAYRAMIHKRDGQQIIRLEEVIATENGNGGTKSLRKEELNPVVFDYFRSKLEAVGIEF